MDEKKLYNDEFARVAEAFLVYKVRSIWHEIARMYNEMAAEYNSTMATGFILLTINEEKGTPVTHIAPRMGMEPNSLSRLLKTMQEKGLVVRRKSGNDNRKVFICLTDYGIEMRKLALKGVYRVNSQILNRFSPEKIAAFLEIMDFIPLAVDEVCQQLVQEKKSENP
ncbi:MAG: MarR family transcriptional regulator [Sphingobacteriales bacterium]|nr:MAG: MarR family transcriptional regulator [Sphingobacteriales bacterium]